MRMHEKDASQEQSNLSRVLSKARQDLASQSRRIVPDLAILQGIYKTFLAGGIVDDRKYLVRSLSKPLHPASFSSTSIRTFPGDTYAVGWLLT